MSVNKEYLQYVSSAGSGEIRVPHEQKVALDERRTALVPVFVLWTNDVHPVLVNLIQQSVRDVAKITGQDRKLLFWGNRNVTDIEMPFSSADLYLHECLKIQKYNNNDGYGKQIDTGWLFSLFLQDPVQIKIPHWKIFVTNHDLTGQSGKDQYARFGFGVTSQDLFFSIQSIARFSGNPEVTARNAAIRRIVMHEVGHLYQLPNRNFHVEEALGTHCTNVCVMRQGFSVEDWTRLGLEENKKSIIFCDDCRRDLEQLRPNYRPWSLKSIS